MAVLHESLRPPTAALRWFALALCALAAAGALALVLVVMRVPAVASAADLDPALVRRCLVVHVDLATGVWFFATIAGLARLSRPRASAPRFVNAGVAIATAGVLLLLSSALLDPPAVLSDYVPVLDHAAFLAGLVAFAIGVSLEIVWWRSRPHEGWLPVEVKHGLHAAGTAFGLALLTIIAAYLSRDPSAARTSSYQELFWGGGHVLQFAATAGMLASWLLLFHQSVGTHAITSRGAALVFALLVAPTALGPALVLTRQAPAAFTTLMEVGIFPAVLIVTVVGAARALRHGRPSDMHWPVQTIATRGLFIGVAMTFLGFVLGAKISGNTTLTPAHYHVSIGAVTVTFMTTLLVLLPRFGVPVAHPRLAMWQPCLYGSGQTLFALGLAIAGFWGHAGRKLYDAEPHATTPVERIGWTVAGVGGLLALAGGIVFVMLVVSSVKRAAAMRRGILW
jgi:hypothetical protein